MPEEWDAIQRDLNKLEKWVHVNLMSFNMTKCKVQHLVQGSLQCQDRLWDEVTGSSLAVKGLRVMAKEKLVMSQQ